MKRVETVRFEMLNELRYGKQPDGRTSLEPRVINAEALDKARLRLNIGAGHIPLENYVNVDMRELPGIDVIAMVDDLPFEPGTVDEIFSSHTLEHFPQESLRRQLLPYWVSLLKSGGTLGVVAPDVEAMSEGFVRGDTSFEDFREVLYGGQEYEGDTHFTGFTPDSCCALLLEAGLVDPVIVARDRPNGKCKEFEITARKAE
jgi:predicted SAM-dependent methyltransferase